MLNAPSLAVLTDATKRDAWPHNVRSIGKTTAVASATPRRRTRTHPLAAGDLNGDGRLDVATPNVGGGDVSVLLGQSGGRLAPAADSPHAVASRP